MSEAHRCFLDAIGRIREYDDLKNIFHIYTLATVNVKWKSVFKELKSKPRSQMAAACMVIPIEQNSLCAYSVIKKTLCDEDYTDLPMCFQFSLAMRLVRAATICGSLVDLRGDADIWRVISPGRHLMFQIPELYLTVQMGRRVRVEPTLTGNLRMDTMLFFYNGMNKLLHREFAAADLDFGKAWMLSKGAKDMRPVIIERMCLACYLSGKSLVVLQSRFNRKHWPKETVWDLNAGSNAGCVMKGEFEKELREMRARHIIMEMARNATRVPIEKLAKWSGLPDIVNFVISMIKSGEIEAEITEGIIMIMGPRFNSRIDEEIAKHIFKPIAQMASVAGKIFELAVKDEKFGPECFDVLSDIYDNPVAMRDVFCDFVVRVLQDTKHGIDKRKLLRAIHAAVRLSPVMLDGFICAIYEVNEAQSVTKLHTFLNKKLVNLDWSCMTCSSLLLVDSIRRGCLDLCVFELLFAHSKPEKLARSMFVDVEAKDIYALLTEKARNTFADAVLIKYQGVPDELTRRIMESDESFMCSVFRRRQDMSIVAEAFVGLSVEDVDMIYGRITKLEMLAFFVGVVLVNAVSLPDALMTRVMGGPDFPSDDIYFPTELFLETPKCVENMPCRVFFDLEAAVKDEYAVASMFNHVAVGVDPLTIFQALFRAPEKSRDRMKCLFLLYIADSDNMPAEIVRTAVNVFLVSDTATICDFCTKAVSEDVRLDVFLDVDILRTIFDCTFKEPASTLGLLKMLSSRCFNNQAVVSFWTSPLTFPAIADAISSRKSCSAAFATFLVDAARNAPEQYVQCACRHVRGLPCFEQFAQVCRDRFDDNSSVLHSLNKM